MVYVDTPATIVAREAEALRAGSKHGHSWCHLMADTEEELHTFAKRLGMKRRWFQGDHYDLLPPRRALAVKYGAKEITRREMAMHSRKLRLAKQAKEV